MILFVHVVLILRLQQLSLLVHCQGIHFNFLRFRMILFAHVVLILQLQQLLLLARRQGIEFDMLHFMSI